ncbi:hypothetical protein CSB45_02085 [candidate division KSB3 bacterium]|uniref:VWFA domain-containing protein n=1 Tax=candidate division KSB3 bacterium TaxID=2044937 RepID=A0A2G6EAL7_9BACT|nr:MAG: hypothetical protein CSB45_02085 [candidate division KSB3 bacterium]PIE30872.1 MAG: hypothetical protein CSA57_00695 [candidate division KSB3 bacterium]
MRRVYTLLIICCILAISGRFSHEAFGIDAYFDSEISTNLTYTPNTGTLIVEMLEEELPPILPNVFYKRTIYVEVIFDASKTMQEPDINGIPKISVAKSLVAALVRYFPNRDTQFALRVSGGALQNNCFDSELVVPFSPKNGQELLQALKNVHPTGLSPITYSLRQILSDFQGTIGSKIVFLITDGQDTCDTEPADTCTRTMDTLQEAEFDGVVNILGVNTLQRDVQALLSCLSARGYGRYLDSNRNSGQQLGQLIRESSQINYSILRVLDAETLAEGKILGLYNRRIGDATEVADTATMNNSATTIKPGIIRKEKTGFEIQEIRVRDLPRNSSAYSSHELPPGVYKIEFLTTPPLASYFTIDQAQELRIGVIRSGEGFDLYARAHLSLGNRYYDADQFEEALQEYQKVLDFDPRNVDAHLNMGIIYQDILHDTEQAISHYKRYLELQGPRSTEVSTWFREAQGLPSEEKELQMRLQEREEQLAREEAARLAQEEELKRQKEMKKAMAAYNEILTANSRIRELSKDAVVQGAASLEVIVSTATTDSAAERIALDVGRRMKNLLNQTPDVYVYRERDRNITVKKAVFDAGRGEYVLTE